MARMYWYFYQITLGNLKAFPCSTLVFHGLRVVRLIGYWKRRPHFRDSRTGTLIHAPALLDFQRKNMIGMSGR